MHAIGRVFSLLGWSFFSSSRDAPGETGIGTYSRNLGEPRTVIKFICKSKIVSQSSYARVTTRVRLRHKVHIQESKK